MQKIILLTITLLFNLVAKAQLTEDFEGATFPPTGWLVTQIGTDSRTWQSTALGSGTVQSGTKAAFVPWQNTYGGQLDYLISPQFTPTAAQPFLAYYVRVYQPLNQGSQLKVKVSTDSVQNNLNSFINTVATHDDYYSNGTISHLGYSLLYADLSAYIGQTIYVAFEVSQFSNGLNGGDDWSLDNISMVQCGWPKTSTNTIAICQGNNYTFNGHTYNTTGIYNDTLLNAGGCDSIVTTNLTVTPITNAVTQNICSGSTYSFNGNLLNASGAYVDTFSNTNGCDSIVTLTLVVNNNPILNIANQNITACMGDSIKIDASSSNSGIAISNGITNNAFFTPTSSNIYTVTATNLAGCISTDTVAVSLNAKPTVAIASTSATACAGLNIGLFANTNATQYLWNNNSTDSMIVVDNQGTYTLTATSSAGCTATSTISLAYSYTGLYTSNIGTSTMVSPIPVNNGSTITDANCNEIAYIEPIGTAGLGVVTTTVQIDSTVSTYLGYSIVRRTYTITPSIQDSASVWLYFTQADFDDFNANNGSEPDLPTNINDYSRVPNLKITKTSGGALGIGTNSMIVPEYVYSDPGAGIWYVRFKTPSFSTFYIHTTDSLACRKITTGLQQKICPGSSFVFNGNTISAPGFYTTTYPNQYGCDSNIILQVINYDPPNIDSITTSVTALCYGDSTMLTAITPPVGTVVSTVVNQNLAYGYGIAQDAAGNIYLAEINNSIIKKITPNGTVSTFAGSAGSGYLDGPIANAKFNAPVDMVFDAIGNMYITDRGNQRIRKIDTAGMVSTYAGDGFAGSVNANGTAARFYNPTGIAIDVQNNLFISESGSHLIRKIDADKNVTTFAGMLYNSGLVDGLGVAAKFKEPQGLTMDKNGNLYVADEYNYAIRKITPAGLVTTLAGDGINGSANGIGSAARFNNPSGVAVDDDGNVFVADQYNSRIRKIDTSGLVSTYAGSSYGTDDGDLSTAKFSYLRDLIIDKNGILFINDAWSLSIRKITATQASNIAWNPITNITNATTAQTIAYPYATSTYTVSVTDHKGCSNTASITVTNNSTGDLALATSANANSVIGSTTYSNTQLDGSTKYYADANCNLVAKILDSTDGTNLDATNVVLNVENILPSNAGQAYTPRWFFIEPTNQAAANITLYYTQSDFDAYNVYATANGVTLLPTSPTDAAGISQVRINKVAGSSLGNGQETMIVPNVSWNAINNYWELSFGVSSFSSFYVFGSTLAPLSINMQLSGVVKNNKDELSWAVNETKNVQQFEVQEWQNGLYKTIATVAADNKAQFSYSVLQPKSSNYRIAAIENNGAISYSNTIVLKRNNGNSIIAYPNPANNIVNLDINVVKNTNATIRIFDVTGKQVVQQIELKLAEGSNAHNIDITSLSTGLYTIQLSDGKSLVEVILLSKK